VSAALAEAALAGEPPRVVFAVVPVVAAGAVLVSLRWLAGTAAGVLALWSVAGSLTGHEDVVVAAVPVLAFATLLAGLLVDERRRTLEDLRHAREELTRTAVRDRLTGVVNRHGLAMLGTQIVESARRQGDAVHCVCVDVDGLVGVNERFGHAAGDDVLVAVAEALRGAVRATDVVARTGGGEFVVVGPGTGMTPTELERRARRRLGAAPPVEGGWWKPGVSAGAAMLAPWDDGSLEALVDAAGREMRVRRALRRGVTAPPESASTD
jgi:diguanylate cyclase (GGDEF)-like protein